MGKILISGSIAYDYIMNLYEKFSDNILKDQLENLNVGFTISDIQKSSWWTAHNIAYNLGLLWCKEETIMLAAVGKDFTPEEKLMEYIDYSCILRDSDLFTACAYIITDAKHNQMTNFYPWALMQAVKQHIPEWDIVYAVIAPNAKDAMIMQIKECKEKKIKCFFDPWQALTLFGKDDLTQILETTNYLICNEYEFWLILEKTWLSQEQVILMLEKTIITLGKDGVRLIDKDSDEIIPGLVIANVVDPTWAGDSFRSWLLAWLFRWMSWKDSAKIGNVVASFIIASQWTLHHHFTKKDVENKLYETYGQKISF